MRQDFEAEPLPDFRFAGKRQLHGPGLRVDAHNLGSAMACAVGIYFRKEGCRLRHASVCPVWELHVEVSQSMGDISSGSMSASVVPVTSGAMSETRQGLLPHSYQRA